MIKKGTKTYSILYNKCPKCHEGKFFTYDNPYRLKGWSKMERNCSVCGQSFEPEPGFNYGSMYVSYGLNVIIFITLWVAIDTFRTHEISNLWYFILIAVPAVLLSPVVFRLSRLIWINFFVRYDASAAKKTGS